MNKELALREEGMIEVSPEQVVEAATAQSKLLMQIVEQTKCYQEISGKKYLQVEAWETIGAFNRTHAETESIEPMMKGDDIIGYQAHVQLWKDGQVVGGAVMPCYFTENCCKGKDGDAKHKSAMSAAQTFATSKAYRMNFSYVAILAGFQPLPAEEITSDMRDEVDKTQHYCTVHKTNFFMRGKMKSYAHPIKDNKGEDTGEWCHEHTKKEESKPAPQPEPEPEPKVEHEHGEPEVIQEDIGFDTTWLTSSLKEVRWSEATVKSYLKNIYSTATDGSVIDVVSRLNREQREQFFNEIQKRLDQIPSGKLL